MGFSEEFIKNASDIVVSKTMKADYEFIEKILRQAVANAAQATPYFQAEDVLIYLQGSYASKTNTKFQSKLEVVVEVQKTQDFNYATMQSADFIMHDNFYVEFNHYFDVKRFKECLVAEIQKLINQKVVVGAVNLLIPAFGELQHAIDIFPCFKYKYFDADGGSVRGKLVYDKNLDENYLIFTNLHAANGELKDEMTDGYFKKMVRFFKTLVAISLREDRNIHNTRGYYVECLLYNVPNEMYYADDGKLTSVFLKIINWLNFADLDNFICQNQIWSLWGLADGFWNKSAARQFINDIIEFYELFPTKRTEIIDEEDYAEWNDCANNWSAYHYGLWLNPVWPLCHYA